MNINKCFQYLNTGMPEDIRRRKLYGDFQGAIRLIDKKLADEQLSEALRKCLTVQREMILRTPADYPYSKEQALKILRDAIPDFSEQEFDERVDDGKIGWIYVDGEMRFFERFFSSMCKSEPAFARRAGRQLAGLESAGKGSEADDFLGRCMRIMREKGQLSNRIRIRASAKLKDEHFKTGMFMRVHLPIPAACEQQTDIVIEKIFPEHGKAAPEDALQRTICWEEQMEENHEFYVEYSYIHTARFHDTEVMQGDLQQPSFDTEEQEPHIVFTPYIRELTRTLTEGVKDPLQKARIFYDFITLHMKYTFMPDYFILEDIPGNCARSLRGDCGVFALLFLTLCRCAGIPACWQSGLAAEPDFCGAHDWVRFYIAPYGWMYADPSYGIGAVRAENEERRKFYFGNLDAYRMVANNGFQKPFTIEKQEWRADPYDNQTGEMETEGHGFRCEEFERSKEVLVCEEL